MIDDLSNHLPEGSLGIVLAWLGMKVVSLESKMDLIVRGMNLKAPDTKRKWRTPIVIGFLIGAAILISGCANVTQTARREVRQTNGVVEVYTLRNRIFAVGDAKTAVEKSKLSAGKTLVVGAEGVREEASNSVPASLDSLVRLLEVLRK
jgi:hypothetical protein